MIHREEDGRAAPRLLIISTILDASAQLATPAAGEKKRR